MYSRLFIFTLLSLVLWNCDSSEDDVMELETEGMYFPPVNDEEWAVIADDNLNWDIDKLDTLRDFLVRQHTKSFMILVNGKIALEEYYNGHSADDTWQWNSAGKTLVSATVGIAEQEKLLDINDKVADYIGSGWTSADAEKEALITPYHLLTMTSGLNDEKNLIIPSNLSYLADAGTRWAYSNVFQKLIDVITASSHQDFTNYFNDKIERQIGMEGLWKYGLVFKIYHSNTRSMARFGLLALNNGKWEEKEIISGEYFNNCIKSSQELNPSYGYMWWLNGKSSFMLPGSQSQYQGRLVPSAPDDMYAAMGLAEQRLYVIPSKDMVIVRMGEASELGNSDFALSNFDKLLWDKLNAVIN